MKVRRCAAAVVVRRRAVDGETRSYEEGYVGVVVHDVESNNSEQGRRGRRWEVPLEEVAGCGGGRRGRRRQ